MSESGLQQKEVQKEIQRTQEIANQFFSDTITDVVKPPTQKEFTDNQETKRKTAENQQNATLLEREVKQIASESVNSNNVTLKDNDDSTSINVQAKISLRSFQNNVFKDKIKQQTSTKLLNSQVRNQQTSIKSELYEKSTLSQHKTMLDTKLLEAKIKEIAQAIRKKVKKEDQNEKNKVQIEKNRVIKLVPKDQFVSPLKLSPLPSTKNMNPINNLNDFSQNKLLTFEEGIRIDVNPFNPLKFIKSLLKKQVLEKVYLEIEKRQKLKSKKIKLDPINHHYPMTSFRKSIIQELKLHNLREIQKQKEREVKLSIRRDIYKSSRYQRYTKMGSILQRSLFQELKQENKEQSKPFTQVFHQNPQISETAQATLISAEKMQKMQVKQTLNLSKQAKSLDTKIGNEDQGMSDHEWDYQ